MENIQTYIHYNTFGKCRMVHIKPHAKIKTKQPDKLIEKSLKRKLIPFNNLKRVSLEDKTF